MLLQGICNQDRIFLNVCMLALGGMHDATHLRKSFFYKKLMDSEILQDLRILIEARQMKPYIVGDYANLVLQQLIKLYKSQRFNRGDKHALDECVQRERVKIEYAFRNLKNCWTMLKSLNYDTKHARTIIIACCGLHNFCILQMIEDWHIQQPTMPTT